MPEPGEVRVTCYEIASDGQRGAEHVIVGKLRHTSNDKPWLNVQDNGPTDASECAERVAAELDEERLGNATDRLLILGVIDGWIRVIEVVGHPGHPEPVRFRVRCELKREYTATEANA